MQEIEGLKRAILKEYPRLSENSTFSFRCHKEIPCFNDCCGDVNIFLTPYDIIRLKNNLGIDSQEFLTKYTITPFDKNLRYPVVMLEMGSDEKKKCPFVTEDGCGVYQDRPWSCRMYPLGLASPKEGDKELDREFYFLLQEGVCKGHGQDKEWTVKEWLKSQGIADYDAMGELFKELTLHDFFEKKDNLTPEKLDMFFMVCYNIDKFRTFIFKSTFFERFEVTEEVRGKIEKDDEQLLKFGFEWLKFAMFGEKTMTAKKEAIEKQKKIIEDKQKLEDIRIKEAEKRAKGLSKQDE